MKITFLGTGAGLPSKERHTQSTLLNLQPFFNESWLFDVGEAIQHQVLHTNIKLGKITRIFITHLHGDHVFGLPGLLTSRSFQGGAEIPLTLYGPKGLETWVTNTLHITSSHLNYPLEIVEIADNMELDVEGIRINVHLLKHGVPSFGYKITMPVRQGALLTHKLKEHGIEAGPIYRLFKEQDRVEVGGVTYDAHTFRSEPRLGHTISFFGDTMPCDNEALLAQGCDVMVHECTYLTGDLELSHKYFHSHIDDVVQLALNNNVKHTILNHISNRYTHDEVKLLVKEIKHNYPEFNFSVAHDFMTFTIE